MKKKVIRPFEKVHYASFPVAGFQYYQGCEVFEQLKVGIELELVRDDENPYDPEAVAIFYGNTHIGYVPRACNHDICMLLDMGAGKLFEVRICRVDPEQHPERQIEVNVYLKNQNDC